MSVLFTAVLFQASHASADWVMNGLVDGSYKQSRFGISGMSRDAAGYSFLGSDNQAHPFVEGSDNFRAIISNNDAVWGFVQGKCIRNWSLKDSSGSVVCGYDGIDGSSTDLTGLPEALTVQSDHTVAANGLNFTDSLSMECDPIPEGKYSLEISGLTQKECGRLSEGGSPGAEWSNTYDFNYSLVDEFQDTSSLFPYNEPHTDRSSQGDYEKNRVYKVKHSGEKIVGAYYAEWARYKRNGLMEMYADQIPFESLSHLLYAFIPVCGLGHGSNNDGQLALCTVNDCGDVEVSNPYFALQSACAFEDSDYQLAVHDAFAATGATAGTVPLEDGSTIDVYAPSYQVMSEVKAAGVKTKILPSIGGWSLSKMFYGLHEEANMDKFVSSCEKFLRQWNFYDGIDIDWEFPGGLGADAEATVGYTDFPEPSETDCRPWATVRSPTATTKVVGTEGCSSAMAVAGTCTNGQTKSDGEVYVELMKKLRVMLDKLSSEVGKEYQLSSAVSGGAAKIAEVNYGEISSEMDHIFVMSYDFMGGWNKDVGHQTNLYHPSGYEGMTVSNLESVDSAITAFTEQGFPAEKLAVGVGMYGRGWKGTSYTKFGDRQDHVGSVVECGADSCKCNGNVEMGVVDYSEIVEYLASGTCVEEWDECALAPIAYCDSTGEAITYDNAKSVYAKGTYVHEHNLGGLFAWVLDQDSGEILDAMNDAMAKSGSYVAVNRPASCNGDSGPGPVITTSTADAVTTTTATTATTTNATTTTKVTTTTTKGTTTTTKGTTTTTKGTTTTTKGTTSSVVTDAPPSGECVDKSPDCVYPMYEYACNDTSEWNLDNGMCDETCRKSLGDKFNSDCVLSESSEPAGKCTNTVPDSECLYISSWACNSSTDPMFGKCNKQCKIKSADDWFDFNVLPESNCTL